MAWTLRIVVACLLTLGTLPASAADQILQVKFWGGQAKLPIPEGFCPLSDSQAMDREILENVRQFNEGRNEVLAMFAACGELDALRTQGQTLVNFGSYLAGLSAGPKPLAMKRPQFVASLADHLQANDPFAAAAQDIQDRAARIGAVLEREQMVSLGLLLHNEAAAYTGVILPDAAEGARPGARNIVVTSITLLQGHPVSVNLGTAYRDANTLAPLLSALNRLAHSWVAAN